MILTKMDVSITTGYDVVSAIGGPKPICDRNPQWAERSAAFKVGKVCRACRRHEWLEVHHICPVHLFPEKEMVEQLWVVLCNPGSMGGCHLLFGHLQSWSSYNMQVEYDVSRWAERIGSRP